MESSKPHALLLPSPGVGHLVRHLELGNRLVAYHNFHVTLFVVFESLLSAGESQLIQSAKAQKLITIVELPPVDISGKVEPAAQFFTKQAAITREIQPSLRSTISTLTLSPTALIVDLFATPALDVADEFHILKFVFFPSAWPLSLMLYLPILDKEISGQYVDQKEPLKIPGCMSIQPEDAGSPMLDRTKDEYHVFLQRGSEMRMSDGILLNTWENLDSMTLKALRENESFGSVPIYAVGPFVRPVGPSASRSNLLNWLDEQPSESVIYISFGSVGFLSAQQITELAFGLELSQQRFIWVLRPPANKKNMPGKKHALGDKGNDALDYLPDGFLTRTQGLGLVVTQWAPQVDILSHPSTGGFLSHCGWNSALESILNGVPLLAWPLYAEQSMNAILLSEKVGVAVNPKVAPTRGVVRREEIEMLVRKVMGDQEEGKALRARVMELKVSGEKALIEGGSSFNAMSQFAKQCEMKMLRN
ncbi:anthocyanidin 3-O-glucosyltransferase 5-like [Juglans microcarpa x Juglans regia]|uniref:anthocyanidin 3-O-glucosyltransferase 5-like n=1 Tax=Juglans microcarpa x Juglans regia TaxID=2249226 RepID=UPI001B7E7B7E|nr:anthocyanidin 3-O-glucosyltransferase 5-like [Juglans microcarpa x Juglans regia]